MISCYLACAPEELVELLLRVNFMTGCDSLSQINSLVPRR